MSLENKCCDLHTHSTASDGTWTPEEIILEARRQGIAVALTDHNTVSGLSRFTEAAKKHGVEAVPGVELSCDCFGREMHVLALFLKESVYDDVMEFTRQMREHKKNSNRSLADNLTAGGYPVELDRIIADNPNSYINRSHFARELVRLGYVKDIDEAFDTLLSKKAGFVVTCPKPSVEDAVRFVTDIGAVSVIAHPYLKYTTEELERIIPEVKKYGLAGMETSYSEYTPAMQAEAETVAMRHGLLFSGGSDFHGNAKPEISLGNGMGDLRVPYDYYLRLKEYSCR